MAQPYLRNDISAIRPKRLLKPGDPSLLRRLGICVGAEPAISIGLGQVSEELLETAWRKDD
jgi:hypothetical protein